MNDDADDEMGRIRRVESKWSPRFALWLSRLRWLPGVDCDHLCNDDEDFDDLCYGEDHHDNLCNAYDDDDGNGYDMDVNDDDNSDDDLDINMYVFLKQEMYIYVPEARLSLLSQGGSLGASGPNDSRLSCS